MNRTRLILSAALVALLSASSATAQSAPQLQLSTETWDFGKVWHGQPLSTTVTLTNVGGATLNITDVKSSCGCTVAKPNKRVLAPGESDTMSVTYDSTKLKKHVKQNIRIRTNDPRRPEVVFTIKGEVWHVFDVEPHANITFGLVLPDTLASVAVTLKSNLPDRSKPAVNKAALPSWLDAQVLPIEGKPAEHRLVFNLKPPLPLGTQREQFQLQTGVPQLPVLELRVVALVSEPVSVRPEAVWLLPNVATKPSQRRVFVCFLPEAPIKIERVESNHPAVTARVADRTPRKMGSSQANFMRKAIEISMPAASQIPNEGVEVTIHTDSADPRFKQLTVPVRVGKPG